jgi:hypothetical protein
MVPRNKKQIGKVNVIFEIYEVNFYTYNNIKPGLIKAMRVVKSETMFTPEYLLSVCMDFGVGEGSDINDHMWRLRSQ